MVSPPSAGGLTSSITFIFCVMLTKLPCVGMLPPGQVFGSDHKAPDGGEPGVELLEDVLKAGLEEVLEEETLEVLLVLLSDEFELEEDELELVEGTLEELELEVDTAVLLDEELELNDDEIVFVGEELELEEDKLDDTEVSEGISLSLSAPLPDAPPQPLVSSRRQKLTINNKLRAKISI